MFAVHHKFRSVRERERKFSFRSNKNNCILWLCVFKILRQRIAISVYKPQFCEFMRS
jgi:hypothetical protein